MQDRQGMLAHEHVITWARKHARHVGTWARKHARHASTWARKHARHVGRWTRKHTGYVGTWARKHARHVGTWARKHARHDSRWVPKHARHVDTWARKVSKWHCEDSSFYQIINLLLQDERFNQLRFTLLAATLYLSHQPNPTLNHHLSSICLPKCI